MRKLDSTHATTHASFTVALHLSTSSVKVQETRCKNGLFYDSYLQTCRYGESISPPLKENIDKFDFVVWLDIREMLFSLKTKLDLNETISSLARLFSFDLSKVSALHHIPIMGGGGGVIGGSSTPQHRTNSFEDTASPLKKILNTEWNKYG